MIASSSAVSTAPSRATSLCISEQLESSGAKTSMSPWDMQPSFTRHAATPEEGHVRIHFDLVQDDQGYPPPSSETLWALPVGRSRFRLDNIPFFVCGVSCFDIIEARMDASGHFKYSRLLNPGGHSTLRVIFYDQPGDAPSVQERVQELRKRLQDLGCSSEISHVSGLISVDVPPEVALAEVRSILDEGQGRELWDYEEATLGHSVQ